MEGMIIDGSNYAEFICDSIQFQSMVHDCVCQSGLFGKEGIRLVDIFHPVLFHNCWLCVLSWPLADNGSHYLIFRRIGCNSR